MTLIGIMQGRLLPPTENRIQCFPRANWSDEFELGAKAGIDCIEWIYDLYGADANPLAIKEGVARMKELTAASGVRVLSLCADYFMDRPLLRVSVGELNDRLATFRWLLGRAQLLGIQRMVVPFVDASSINTEAEFEEVCVTLKRVLQMAEETQVEVHLETSLAPERFAELLARLPHPLLKVNYDSGNSSSLGYDPRKEFAAYGARVGSVHIKDRLRGGGTVAPGTGDADFSVLAESLDLIHYSGDFILQVARGTPGDEVDWIRKNRDFVLKTFCKDGSRP